MPRFAQPPAFRSRRGQASVELIAGLPLLVLCVLVAVQLAIAGFGLWTASVASRAGARAAHVGSDPGKVARRALPASLRRASRIRSDGPIGVRVTVPPVVPGLPRLRVGARASLSPDPHGSARRGG
jgi:hypothetical protein